MGCLPRSPRRQPALNNQRQRLGRDASLPAHGFLGHLLGVARPAVTVAAGIRRRAGLITYRRGVVTVLDRPGLEGAACECYAIITAEFARQLDTLEHHSET